MKYGWVYIMTNKNKTTLYVGVTSDIIQRVQKHQTKYYPNSFSAAYNIDRLIYYEYFNDIMIAIKREKEIKKWRREKKNNLITTINPLWEDLWEKEVKYW
jgi:putative endonuclease